MQCNCIETDKLLLVSAYLASVMCASVMRASVMLCIVACDAAETFFTSKDSIALEAQIQLCHIRLQFITSCIIPNAQILFFVTVWIASKRIKNTVLKRSARKL